MKESEQSARPLRILYHHRTQGEDAQGIHIHEIIKCFRNDGHEVREVALVEAGDGPRERVGETGWSTLSNLVPEAGHELMEILYNPVGYHKLARAVRRFGPDFIYERYALYNAAGVLVARRFGIPLILEVNSPLALEQSELGKLTFRRLARASEGWICSRSSRTLAVTTPLKQILVESGVPEEQVEVCPNGVDPVVFDPETTSGAPVRQRYGLAGKRVLGFVGWVRDWHGLAELVASMGGWGREMADVHLLVIGDGPARWSIEEAARATGVSDRVHVIGAVRRTDMAPHIAAIDLALQPAATSYASPMKIFEYLAMGKPVVAPRQPNLEEILTEGRNARFFRPGDREDLARVAAELLRDREALRRMSGEARRTVFERGFLWSANARRAVEIARGLLGRSV